MIKQYRITWYCDLLVLCSLNFKNQQHCIIKAIHHSNILLAIVQFMKHLKIVKYLNIKFKLTQYDTILIKWSNYNQQLIRYKAN